LAGSVDAMPLEHGSQGWHLPHQTAKAWKQLEQTLRLIGEKSKKTLPRMSRNPIFFLINDPELPSKFGYFTTHPTEDAARSALRSSLDAFVVYCAYLSFATAFCRLPGSDSSLNLIPPRVHAEFSKMFMESHIVDLSGERKRIGTIINVLQCSWISTAEVLLKAKVPIWLYWGDHPLTVTPRAGWMADHRPRLVDLNPPSVNNLLPSLPPTSIPSQSQSSASRNTKKQLPGETYKQYFTRRQQRNEARMQIETAQDKQIRADRDKLAAKRQCPGRKGPAVYCWELDDNDLRVRTLQTRKQVDDVWSRYSGHQKVYNSFDNEWDCCSLFGDDSDTDDDDIPRPTGPSHQESTFDALFLPAPPISTTTNDVIPENVIASTSPPPHEELTSMDVDPPSLPHPHPVFNAIASSSTLPHEESTSMDVDAPFLLHPHPVFNVIASSSTLPPLHKESTPPVPSYQGHRPRLSPRDDSRRDTHGHCRPRLSPGRSSRDHSPTSFRRTRDPRDDSPARPCRDLQAGDGRSLPRRSRSREPVAASPSSHPSQESHDVLAVSRDYVLSVHPPDTTIIFAIQTDSVEDYVYHRFGFQLDEHPYTGVPLSAFTTKFSDWLHVLRSIGCHELNSSLAHRQPIQEFLQCLLSTNDPLRDVPAKFWDLNAKNGASLDLAAGLVRIEPKKFVDGTTRYLIHPVDPNARSSSWVLAVDAMTALECVRRHLGPHTTDIADFLINRGIPFSTLRRMPSIPGPRTPPRPISTHLGHRPANHKFDLADFSGYQFLCESVVKREPFCRAALCMGGIVARLAREIIPNSTALLGPSQDALEGSQRILVSGDEFFCDDQLSLDYSDLICGVYKIPTGNGSTYTPKFI
jgi:hypothetical protein